MAQAFQMQMEVQKRLHEQLEARPHAFARLPGCVFLTASFQFPVMLICFDLCSDLFLFITLQYSLYNFVNSSHAHLIVEESLLDVLVSSRGLLEGSLSKLL